MACFGGDPQTPDVGEQTRRALEAFIQNYPGLIKVVNEGILPQEQAALAASKAVSPEYARLGAETANIANLGDIGLVEGSGARLAKSVNALNREIDPEFYSTRAAASNALEKALAGFDTSGELTGSERAEIERSVNREGAATGNLGTGAPINVIKNAMQFGKAATDKSLAKTNALSQAINSASGLLSQSRSGIDPFKIATGKTQGAVKDTSKSAEAGQNVFGQIASGGPAWAQNEAQRRGPLERFTQSIPDVSC